MLRLTCVVLLCAGCKFAVPSVVDPDGAAPVEDGAAPDLAGLPPSPDLATGDALSAADLADPCGPFVMPAAGVAASRCTTSPPVIDGNLAEWGALDYKLHHRNSLWQSTSNSWTDNAVADDADCSAQYSLRWDAANLYVAVHVDDDVRGVHPNAQPYLIWLEDAVEIYLDGQHDRSVSYGADDHQYITTADGNSVEFQNGAVIGPTPAGYVAVRPDALGAGYSAELRVPWSVLGATPASGALVGFDLLIDDDDNPATQMQARYLGWQNNGTGGACTYPAGCTGAFGALQLTGR